MKTQTALIAAFVLSLAGVLFSGTLSYQELFTNTAVQCPSVGTPGTIFGYPACVYGFGMFVVLTVVTGLGVFGDKKDLTGTARFL